MAFCVVVKNSFIDMKFDDPDAPGGQGRPVVRSSSCDALCSRRRLPQPQLDHLNAVVRGEAALGRAMPRPAVAADEAKATGVELQSDGLQELRQLQSKLSEALASFGQTAKDTAIAIPSTELSTPQYPLSPRSEVSLSTLAPSDADVEEDQWSPASPASCSLPESLPVSAEERRAPANHRLATSVSAEERMTPASHRQSPKFMDLSQSFRHGDASTRPTTMMIRNIPNNYTQSQFMEELAELGFKDTYDFLYLPVDKRTVANLGYAFVNFVDACWANRCMAVIGNYSFNLHGKARRRQRKIATVSVAYIQGLENNVAHYQNTEVRVARKRERRPMFLGGGQ